MPMMLDVTPLTPAIGAIVSGVDLREPLDPPVVDELKSILLDRLVLLFRDQDISTEQQMTFAQHFGPVLVPTRASPVPKVTVLDKASPEGREDYWHADGSQLAEPPFGAVLRAVQLPTCGGDTCFSSMYAAYDTLSSPVRDLLDGLTALHSFNMSVEKCVHPVVRVHPETGRKLLNVNSSKTVRILELQEQESDTLLSFLFEHITSPKFQCRLHWEPNSIAFWDNRAVQHYPVSDYTERRIMYRVQIEGDKPFGPMDQDGDAKLEPAVAL